jgi:cobalt-zinc-cadmium efflux system protein
VQRLLAPLPVSGGVVTVVAGIGILINAVTAMLFMSGRKADINLEGASLHMAADAAVSVGVLIAGALIRWTHLLWLDPVVSLLIVVVITWTTWGLLRKSVGYAMDAVRPGIDPDAVRRYLAELPGVTAVHDLHIWGMSTTETALTVHLVKPDVVDEDDFLATASRRLHDSYAIEHVTIQIERGTAAAECRQASEHVV